MADDSIFIAVSTAVFGLCVGSFLNVVIHRLPLSRSIVHPPSSCPKCGRQIRFYENIPVISYLLLGGRCRGCKTEISIRYPVVELLGGCFAVLVLLRFGLTASAAIYYVFVMTLLAITFIDIDHQIIPDVMSLPGIPLFFLASFVVPALTWKQSLVGILVGGGSLYAVAVVYSLLTGRSGMGGGDIKLLGMIGAMVGATGVFFTIFVSSLVGTAVGMAVMLAKGKDFKLKIPFGPFLAAGAVSYIFFGPQVIRWYFNLMG